MSLIQAYTDVHTELFIHSAKVLMFVSFLHKLRYLGKLLEYADERRKFPYHVIVDSSGGVMI
jgi:hypothetical protein